MRLRPRLRPSLVFLSAAGSILSLVHCTGNASENPITTDTIGAAGGAFASDDYVMEVLVPPDAITADGGITLTITPVNAPDSVAVAAPAYTVGPAGLTFATPVVISFSEEDTIAPNAYNDPTDFRVATYASNAWVPLANPSYDALAGTLEATTTRLTSAPYSVVVPTGGTCVEISEPGGTCAPSYPGKCAAYVGAVVNACTTTATEATVKCCFPSGEPLCFTQAEPTGCGSPCAQFPGSSVQSCIPDVGPPFNGGVTGGLPQSTCCFAAGTSVCTAAPAGGCATGTTAGPNGSCCEPVGTLPATLPAGGSSDGGTIADSGGGTDAGGTDAGAEGASAEDGGGADSG
jgi:hypothetical protein